MERGARVGRVSSKLAVAVLVSLLAALALPAHARAAEGGTGRLAGAEETLEYEESIPSGPLCLHVLEVRMQLRGVGTFQGRTDAGERAIFRAQVGEGQALQEGPLRLVIESEDYYMAPEGTYRERTSPSEGCDESTYADEGKIPATVTLYAEDHVHDGDEPCRGEGHWWRVHSSVFAEWSFESECAIEGNEPGFLGAGTVSPDAEHALEGNFDPCWDHQWPCDDNIRVSFRQRFPSGAEAADASASGPASGGPSQEDRHGPVTPRHLAAAMSSADAEWNEWLLALFGAGLAVVKLSFWRQRRTSPQVTRIDERCGLRSRY